MYIVKNAVGIFWLWELGFWLTRLGSQEISHRLWENQPPTLGKSATDFGKIRHRLWENQPPTLKKSVADFGEIRHRFWGNPSLILGKSVTDFGEIRHRFWEAPFLENQAPCLGKKPSQCLGQTGFVFEKNRFRFRGNLPPTWGKSVIDFGKICHQLWRNQPPTLGNSVFGKNSFRFWEKHVPFLG